MFWIIAAVLVFIALALILPPLLKPTTELAGAGESSQQLRRLQNIEIAKEQLNELEQRFEKGEMDNDAYQQTRDELELALYNNMQESEQDSAFDAAKATSKKSFLGSVAIALLVPLIAIGTYLKLGDPVFTTDLSSRVAAKTEIRKDLPKKADGTPDVDAMVSSLQKKMEANPDNAKGWFMLGRSYMVMKRYPDAVKAYEQVNRLMPNSPNVMLSLADAISMKNNGQIAGRPAELIEQVLKVDPANVTGLWLGGMAARQQLNYVTAVERWQKVLPLLDTQKDKNEVNSLIAEAMKNMSPEQLKAMKKQAEAIAVAARETAAKGIRVHVALSDTLKSQANPDDLVFIYAKAVSGPPMPLAVARKRVKDLPVDIVLDDSMAMMPNMKLSGFSEVVIGARVSKSGRPIAQKGDLFTEKMPVKAGQQVDLLINSIKGQAAPQASKPPVQQQQTQALTASAQQAPPLAAAKAQKPAMAGQGITVTVSLSEAMMAQAKPDDLVFIYAKAVSGPPMPLAAAKKQVKDLPVTITLDDSMAMMPGMKLSGFSEVVVGARVSKTGRPIPQNGDLFTEKKPIKAGDSVELIIDSVVKK